MSFVVYHIESCRYTIFATQAAAKRSCTAQNKKANRVLHKRYGYYGGTQPALVTEYAWASFDHFDANINVWTTTYNMLDPDRKPIPIRLADKGGCCDPATERYHCM